MRPVVPNRMVGLSWATDGLRYQPGPANRCGRVGGESVYFARGRVPDRVLTSPIHRFLWLGVLAVPLLLAFPLVGCTRSPKQPATTVQSSVRVKPSESASQSVVSSVAVASSTSTVSPPKMRRSVIAWQPSHQDDTGDKRWHEYKVCGSIVDVAIAALPEYRHVKAWEISMGLTGTNTYRPRPMNTKAFDAETKLARDAATDTS